MSRVYKVFYLSQVLPSPAPSRFILAVHAQACPSVFDTGRNGSGGHQSRCAAVNPNASHSDDAGVARRSAGHREASYFCLLLVAQVQPNNPNFYSRFNSHRGLAKQVSHAPNGGMTAPKRPRPRQAGAGRSGPCALGSVSTRLDCLFLLPPLALSSTLTCLLPLYLCFCRQLAQHRQPTPTPTPTRQSSK